MDTVATVKGILVSRAASIEEKYHVSEHAKSAAVAVSEKAESLNERFSVVERAKAAGEYAAEKAQAVDERFNVSAKVKALDERFAGGTVTPWATSAYERGMAMASQSLGYVSGKLEEAKLEQKEASKDGEEKPEEPAVAAAE